MTLTEEEAKAFFSEFFYGDHHIPKGLSRYGEGWCVNVAGSLATFDRDDLTRLVFMAHDKAIRVEIAPASPKTLKIAIHKRQRTGSIYQRHPSIDDLLEARENV